MNSRIRAKLLPLAIASLLAGAPAFAQDTSSAISGRVVDASGKPVANATVKVVHEPSGTTKIVTTDADGRYAAQGLRVGGPFDVVATSAGGQQVAEQHDVYLALSQNTAINLSPAAAQGAQSLEGVTVSASSLASTFSPDNKGLTTNLSRRELEAVPTPNRSIQDIARLDPRVQISDRDRGQISALGQNFRYNSITIDSVSAGDPFGLEDNGLASVGSPISQDTIEEYNISTANYDVAARRGVGASINAVTKSGTNEFHGSVYYAFQNTNDMVGELRNSSGQSSKYNGFDKNWTAGATVGGPIIKDKLFFFAGYEEAKKTGVGTSYGPRDSSAANPVQGLTNAQVQQITNLATQLGLKPGNYTDKFDMVDKRSLIKFDWNITDSHRATFRYNRTKENQPIATAGGTTYLNLSSDWYYKNRDNKSYTLNFYDDWNETFSTEAAISYSTYDQGRSSLVGGAQPYIQVYPGNDAATGGVNVAIGTEPSSQVNALKVKTWNAFLAATVYLDDHTLKGGVDFEQDDYYNAFLQRAYGSYQFNLNQFANGGWYNYQLKTPVNGYSLDDVAARYKLNQYGLFLQDTWQVTPALSLQYGVRLDIPLTNDKPLENPCFAAAPGKSFTAYNANGSVACVAAKGGFGYSNSTTINGNRVVQPRLSFNYAFDTERMTQLRGGAGLFIANGPSVWLSNSYANNGFNVGTYNVTDNASGLPGSNLAGVGAKPAPSYDPNNPITPGTSRVLGSSSAKMAVDTVDRDFKQPTVWKMSLAVDHELPWMGIVASLEWIHLKVRDGILYQNINLGAPTGTTQDGRNIYWGPTLLNGALSNSSTNERYNSNQAFDRSVTRLTNTSKGKSDNVTLSFKKAFSDSWFGAVGFSWNRATDVNPGTSSVASSNYQGNVWTNPNEDKATTSLYSIPKRVLASLSWQHRFFGDYATTISATYDGHSGSPYSWVFGSDVNGDGYARDLAYIPSSVNDVKWAAKVTDTMKQQFMDYVNSDGYLSSHKGGVAGRNATRAPWLNQLDLSFRQEIPGLFDGNKGVVSLDIYNFTNMVNKKWGVERRATFPGIRSLADAVVDANGKYVYDISASKYKDAAGNYIPNSTPLPVNESLSPSQRWSAMLTVKYTF
ncbi:hypothetical protein FHW69_003712 [Luteibacter sp. Sphag1AF]|uniref:TonB-dependent receptor n=1 Tax=Luteibacter sp. Sphag1AF TaxID=2587031 RepID=UPI00160E3548|nr:carboxypeptidase regulatory-like domain-containing protein [Luteibacter sp. Sphag1AF]MBB3229063.1 hypothetical protein [Luteibacter sp. Sphag1AF]